VIRGKFRLVIEGKNNDLEDDSAIIIPPNAKHSGVALTDCKVVDVFSPVREDYKKFDKPSSQE
jgi:quercetin dioxygenase-like cupin family protein